MVPRRAALSLDAVDPLALATFWGALLQRDAVRETDAVVLPGDDRQVGLRFVAGPAPVEGPERVHLHLTTRDDDDRRRLLGTIAALGGEPMDVGQLPEEDHVVMRDPGGAAFCVIEPGNAYLAGCGRLGELACDGSREVALFWRDALGWPLVWDQAGETAVQSPAGGTKIAWGGPPVVPRRGRCRQRLDLVVAGVGLDQEVERLVALGATRGGEVPGGVEMTDPDGNELRVVPG